MKIKAFIIIIALTVLFEPILISEDLYIINSGIFTIPLLILMILCLLILKLISRNKSKIVENLIYIINIIYWILVICLSRWYLTLSSETTCYRWCTIFSKFF